MNASTDERHRLLETILDHTSVSLTYADTRGVIKYVNRKASERPSKTPRKVGMNLQQCHSRESSAKIVQMFDEFANGRREPQHYVIRRNGKKELAMIISVFESDTFIGCIGQMHPLEIEGPERSSAESELMSLDGNLHSLSISTLIDRGHVAVLYLNCSGRIKGFTPVLPSITFPYPKMSPFGSHFSLSIFSSAGEGG